jgi:thymidine kinase
MTDTGENENKNIHNYISSENTNSGYLELIIGPMYAGKSTELLRIINRYKCLNKKICVVNHSFNNRYGSTGLTTHNRTTFDQCVIIAKLAELDNDNNNAILETDVIIIEELQFFEDAFEYVVKWCDSGKIVICAGLDGDYLRNPFGDVLRLIPHADKVTKLNSLCKKCGDGKLAHFTKRIVSSSETTLVGSDEIYEAVCRKHYLE